MLVVEFGSMEVDLDRLSSSDSVGRLDKDRLRERSLDGDLRELASEGLRESARAGAGAGACGK